MLGLLGLVLVLVTGALIYITTPPGEKRIRAFAVEQANKQLAGRLELGGLDLSLLALKLTGVKLYDPEGELVAEVGEVEAHVDILPLLRKQVVVRDAHLRQPHLSLHQDAKGLNLSRAIASRTPSKEPEKPQDTSPGTLRFSLEDFHLEGGAVDFVSEATDGTQRELKLERLDASATGSWASATEALAAQLDATAHLARPLDGPVHLGLKAQGEQGKLGANVDFGAPGLVLEARGGTEGEKQAHVDIQKFSLAPELGRALVPSYPVATPVGLEGSVVEAGNLVKLALNAQAAGGTAEARGAVDIEKFYTDGFTARVRDMDLAKLTGGGPSSALAADLTVRGGGKSLETLVGTLDLTLPPSPIAGQTLGPVEVHASAERGHFTLSRLQAQAPGLKLEASGAGTQEDVRLQGRLQAPDLATFANTVGRLGSGKPLPLSGKGDLHFTAEGALRHPAITLDGGFDTLAWADTKLQGLWVELRLPDATKPLTSDALLKVKQLMAGGQTYDNLKASLTTHGREITASVNTTGRMNLSFALRGLVDKDGEGLALQDLSLKYPDDGWTLQAPTHLAWGNGRTVVEPALTLTSGPQQLSLALKLDGQRIASTVDIKAFDLSRLPKPFLPDSAKNLAGHMSGHVQVNGRMPRPDAQASLKLEGGRYDKYSNLGFDLQAKYLRDRATGTFAAHAPAGRVSSKFDVPVQGLLNHRREPVNLELTVDHLDLGQAQRMAGQTEALTGIVSGMMTLKGMANDPRLKLDLKGEQLRYWAPGQPPPVVLAPGALPQHLEQQPQGEVLGFTLNAQSDDKDGTLSASLDLKGIASKATAHLETPLTLGRLMAKPPTTQQLLNTPMRKLQMDVEDLSLALLSQFGMADNASGTLSMKADLTGPMLAPVGELKLQARKATMNGVMPLDADGQLVTDASAVKLQLSARHDDKPLAQLEARVNASLAALQDQDVVGRVPFTLAFKAGPISQNELMGLAQAAPGNISSQCGNTEFQVVKQASSSEPQNILSMDLKARGTLDAPQVDLTAGVQNIGMSQVGLGQANLHYTYDAMRSEFTAQLASPKGGTLVAKGSLVQDLSLPALRRGLNTDRAPVVVDVDAHQFDLSFLSGSQLPMVRSIAGQLAMDKVHVDGTLGAPNLRGKIEWKDGRIALDGMGDYRDVHVALEVNEQNLTLSDFSAKSSGGKLELKAQAQRGAKGQYALTGEGRLDDFPLVTDDQLVAFIQLRTQFQGEVGENLINIKNLTISEAHVKLPDDKRKDLQPLDRPEGIVLVCQGKPLKPEDKPKEDANSGTGGSGKPAPQRRYWVNINAPRNLWVNGSDVNVEVGLGENFRIEYADALAINGQVNVMRGDVSVLGRRFTLQNTSQVRFTGPVMTPYINATAEYDNEKAGVKVYIAVRGQGKDFTIKPTSDPPLPETDIYTLLATGRRNLTAGSGQSSMNQGQVASVLGSLLASQARKVLASKLPLDVLTIEAGDQGLQDAHLEVGKYLTDSLYLGYSGRLGTPANQSTTRRQNNNAVRLEYQFSRRWGVQAEYGDEQQGGADIIWSNEY